MKRAIQLAANLIALLIALALAAVAAGVFTTATRAAPQQPTLRCAVGANCVLIRRDGRRCINWQHGAHAADRDGWSCK